jgi:membrane fusion protein, adhesin transport system
MAHSPNGKNYPAQYLPAFALTGRNRGLRWLGRFLLLFFLSLPFLLAYTPWQQNLQGEGRVIELDPVNRPMPIQARTDGILLKWHVREGSRVVAGQPIVDLADNDPRLLERLQEQQTAGEQKLAAAKSKRSQYAERVIQAENARAAAMRVADDQIIAATQAVGVARQNVEVARATVQLNAWLETMFTGLVADRIAAGFELQRAQQQKLVATAEVKAREAAVEAALATERAAVSNRARVESDEQAKVQSAMADRDAADGDIADAEGSLLRLQRDLERQRQQQVKAPLSGFVQNLNANGQGGVFVKAGTTLARLIPDTKQMAVELIVDGNDVTFIDEGRHVRLQFEGWPAIQWVGWPSAAVGTFGGKVEFVDRFDDGSGNFRVMVVPDERPFLAPEGPVVDWLRDLVTFEKVSQVDNPHAWPDETWLRQGVRAKGWIVLDRVSLGFEIWRQLNGFPPMIDKPKKAKGGDDKGAGDDKDDKK